MTPRRSLSLGQDTRFSGVLPSGPGATGSNSSATRGASKGWGGGLPAQAGRPAVNTPRWTFAMITHAGDGDTFWDIIRHGALAAAAKSVPKEELRLDTEEGGPTVLVQQGKGADLAGAFGGASVVPLLPFVIVQGLAALEHHEGGGVDAVVDRTQADEREAPPQPLARGHMRIGLVVDAPRPLCKTRSIGGIGNSTGNTGGDSPSFRSAVGSRS